MLVRSFARTAHSFACFGLLASLAPSTSLTRSLACSLCSLRSLHCLWESEFLKSPNDLGLSHSVMVSLPPNSTPAHMVPAETVRRTTTGCWAMFLIYVSFFRFFDCGIILPSVLILGDRWCQFGFMVSSQKSSFYAIHGIPLFRRERTKKDVGHRGTSVHTQLFLPPKRIPACLLRKTYVIAHMPYTVRLPLRHHPYAIHGK